MENTSINPALLKKIKASKIVLVVDDEPDINRMIQFQLQAEGYQVLTAFDGMEALEKVAEKRPDLLVLDIMMPKVDGWVVCHSVKGHQNTKHTRIIILTAKTQFAAKIKGLYILQADVYMSKPFDLDELSDNVSKLLSIEEEAQAHATLPGQSAN